MSSPVKLTSVSVSDQRKGDWLVLCPLVVTA